MRVGLVACVLASWAVAACGGRYEVGARGSGGAAGSSPVQDEAGTTASAGAPGACAPCGPSRCHADEQLVPDADGCCSHCEPAPERCATAQQDYAVERERIVAEFSSFTCESALDCVVSYDPSNCGRDCSYLVVTAAGRGVLDRLVILGQRTCTGECITNEVTCPPPPAAECVGGHCALPPR